MMCRTLEGDCDNSRNLTAAGVSASAALTVAAIMSFTVAVIAVGKSWKSRRDQ